MTTSSRAVTADALSLNHYFQRILAGYDKLSLAILVLASSFTTWHIGEYHGHPAVQSAFSGLALGSAAALLVITLAWRRHVVRQVRLLARSAERREPSLSGQYRRQVP